MSQSYGWNLRLVTLLERCIEGSEVTRYLPSHLCPAGDAVCLTVGSIDSWVPVQSSVHNRLWGSSLICLAFRGGVEKWIHIKTQVWKKTLLWSLWIYIWVLKKCSPVQWCYSFIHAFSIVARSYWEADVLAQTRQDRETLTPVSNLQPSVHLTCVSEDERKLEHLEETRTWSRQEGLEEDLDPAPAISNWFEKAWGPHYCLLNPPSINHRCVIYRDCNLLQLISCISILLLRKTHNNNEHMSIFSKLTFNQSML